MFCKGMQSIVLAQLMREHSNLLNLKAKEEDSLKLDLLSLEQIMSLIVNYIFSNATKKADIKADCN